MNTVCGLLLVILAHPPGLPDESAQRWDEDTAAFAAAEAKQPTPAGKVVFVGSSSIRKWDLAKSFPELKPVNRGFGGSQVSDAVHWLDRLIPAARPAAVVLYAGDNDVAADESPERVAADVRDFVVHLHQRHEGVPVLYLAIKPSVARWNLWPQMKEANRLVAAFAAGQDAVTYVDTATPMLATGRPPAAGLFVEDGLHLSAAGYKLWTAVLRPLLAAATGAAGGNAIAKPKITFDMLYGAGPRPDLSGRPLRVSSWDADGEHFFVQKNGRVMRVDARSGASEPAVDLEPIGTAVAAATGCDEAAAKRIALRWYTRLSPDRQSFLFTHDQRLWLCRTDGGECRPLTGAGLKPELVSFAPGGAAVAFVSENEFLTVPVAGGEAKQWTDDATETVRSGKADWVYYEELFGRDWQAYWWSGTGRYAALLRLDDGAVPTFDVTDAMPLHQAAERTRYPKSGDPNPLVELLVADTGSGTLRTVDLSDYAPEDRLVVHVTWLPKDRLLAYVQNREQTWLDVLDVDPVTGAAERLLRERTGAWIDNPGDVKFLADGSFLLPSPRTGWLHLYRCDPDGELMHAVTEGEFEVRSVLRIDEQAGRAYFTAGSDDGLGQDLCSASLAGGDLVRHTTEPGWHDVQLAPQGDLYVDRFDSDTRPTRVDLKTLAGDTVRVLDANPVPDLDRYDLGRYERIAIPTPDGGTLDAGVRYPSDFDPAGSYPVWMTTYGGPYAPTMQSKWGRGLGWDAMLAGEGIVVMRVDPRTASGKGLGSAWPLHRRMGVAECRDLVTAAEWIGGQPGIDADRIGLSGHSFGGYITAYTLTHSKAFAAGIAGAPVTDWRLYDSIYTERYMGTPQGNPEGYRETSVLEAADDLHGRLLLLHGLRDDNVHVQNTLKLADRLQRADKDFRMMIYPRARHGIYGSHVTRLRHDFIRETMLGE